MLFEPLTYRNCFPKERFHPLLVNYKDLEIWIGIDPAAFTNELESLVVSTLSTAVATMAAYIEEEPFFRKSLKPCTVGETAPDLAKEMAAAGEVATAGPMAAKNGCLAQLVGEAVMDKLNPTELIIEVAGDLFLKLESSLIVNIFAEDPDDSGLMGLEILPEQTPLGIGTGLGTKGQPINHSQANAVMIAAKSGAEAGALAIGIGNRVKKVSDLDKVLKHLKLMPEVLAAVFIVEDQIAVHGDNELKLIL